MVVFKEGEKVLTKHGMGKVIAFSPKSFEELGHYPIQVTVDHSSDEDERVNGLGFDHGEVEKTKKQYGITQELKEKLNPHIPAINKRIAEELKKDSETDIFDVAATYLEENVEGLTKESTGAVTYVFRPY